MIPGLPRPLAGMFARWLGFNQVQQIYTTLRSADNAAPITERLLSNLRITYRAGDRDLEKIPKTGPVLVVANHPFGVLEGAVLATVLASVRPDVRILANELLSTIPEIQHLLIPVDALRGGTRANTTGLRRAIEFVAGGGCLVVFPAGEVSSYSPRNGSIADSAWHTSVARMVQVLARRGAAVSTVPVFIEGANSLLFQAMGLIHPKLRTALLARELLNKRDKLVELRVGGAIPSKKLLEIPTPEERTDYLRWRTYLLAERQGYKARTSLPARLTSGLTSRLTMTRRARERKQAPVAAPVDASLLRTEIAALAPARFLANSGGLDVYLAPAGEIRTVLREIGRLREIAFRAVGEGTGKAVDFDRFDETYLHLFAWNPEKQELVGAYRLAPTDQTHDLYTATLFKFGDPFLDKMGPALELGRSFIRAEYQKGFVQLLALWKGIGAFVSRNPRYKILFGPVSISNQYRAVSRELMVTFLERHASLRDWMGLVKNRNPLRKRKSQGSPAQGPPDAGFDLEDLSNVVSDLEPSRAGIPVVLRQYLKLGGKLLGFNVDPEFSNALDGLILVDLTKTEPRLLERYFGKAQAAQFFDYQKGTQTHGT